MLSGRLRLLIILFLGVTVVIVIIAASVVILASRGLGRLLLLSVWGRLLGGRGGRSNGSWRRSGRWRLALMHIEIFNLLTRECDESDDLRAGRDGL